MEGATTLNISSTGLLEEKASTLTADNNVLNLTGDNAKLNLTGDQDLTLTLKGSTKGFTVDATGFEAKLDVTGSDSQDTIKLGAEGGTVTASGDADQIILGAGVDKTVYTTLTASLATAHDTLAGFISGTDKIVVSSAQAIAIAGTGGFVTASVTGTGTLADDLVTAFTSEGMIANGATVVTITGGDDAGTYLVLNDNTQAFNASLDAVIHLTSTTAIVAGDFVAG